MDLPVPAQRDAERSLHGRREVPASCIDVAVLVDAPELQRFDWLALGFWLSYFSLYSIVGWTALRVGQCAELWCRW